MILLQWRDGIVQIAPGSPGIACLRRLIADQMGFIAPIAKTPPKSRRRAIWYIAGDRADFAQIDFAPTDRTIVCVWI